QQDAIKRISVDTLVRVLGGEFACHYDRIHVLDCRFPYEYDGGHITGAININTPEALDAYFFGKLNAATIPSKQSHRTLAVLHCEFSAQRAPRLALYLRSRDRELNAEHYPHLHYPELYVMDGGYRAFFAKHKLHCEPQQYVPMADQAHRQDCKTHARRLR
ncbi:Rhodanese-like domain-containing protein, partial [Thamnocephalis sphaerospora]